MRHYFILMLFIACSLSCLAQKNLNILSVFGEKYRNSDNAVETIISGDALNGTDLHFYRSLVLTDMPDAAAEIEEAIGHDSAKAVSREIKYIDGRLYYAQLMLPPMGNSNRYVFYINRHLKGGDKIMLVYMSGPATLEQINKLIKK